jgi:hypothetical protein
VPVAVEGKSARVPAAFLVDERGFIVCLMAAREAMIAKGNNDVAFHRIGVDDGKLIFVKVREFVGRALINKGRPGRFLKIPCCHTLCIIIGPGSTNLPWQDGRREVIHNADRGENQAYPGSLLPKPHSRGRASRSWTRIGADMNYTEVTEKMDEVQGDLADLHRAGNLRQIRRDFGHFSSNAGSIHLYIEELLCDFKNYRDKTKKGLSVDADTLWYVTQIETPLFRKFRNSNTHFMLSRHLNRTSMYTTASAYIINPGTGPLAPWREKLQRLRSWLYAPFMALRARRKIPPTWEAMFDPDIYNQHHHGNARLELDAGQVKLCRDESLVSLCDKYYWELNALVQDAHARKVLA